MAPKGEDGLIDLLRDFVRQSQENHADLSNQIQELKSSVEGQIHSLDRRVTQHDNHFNTANRILTFVLGGGLLGLILGISQITNILK